MKIHAKNVNSVIFWKIINVKNVYKIVSNAKLKQFVKFVQKGIFYKIMEKFVNKNVQIINFSQKLHKSVKGKYFYKFKKKI